MIDIHSHILPGIDDGARNIEESMQIIREAKQAGFDAIISTSHYIEASYDSSKSQRQELIKELKKNEDILKIYNGAEAYISDNFLELIKEDILPTLNDSRYLLFELPMRNQALNLNEVIYELVANDYVPIIAHPERYSYIQDNPKIVFDLIDRGALFQCNYGSIIGNYGIKTKRTLKKLLKNDAVHFFGSDVHRPNSVYKQMDVIKSKLIKIIGEEKFNELSTINPDKVIKNKEILI